MNPLKILFVEDDKEQQDTFKDDVEVFQKQSNNVSVSFEIAENVREAVTKIDESYHGTDESYHGAIIDLQLSGNEEGGNEIVQILYEEFTKIPIIFVTSFADSVNRHPSVINIRRREDGSYHTDLLLFQQLRDIGLTHIIGGGGLIETQLRGVFLENLLPQIDTWIRYGETYKETDPKRTEKALLRYTLNHLFQRLEADNELFLPIEFYLYPPLPDKITTGSVVKENDKWFVVLSPACDLVARGGGQFTERILFVEVEKETDIVDKALNRLRRITDEEEKEKVKEDILQRLSHNNHAFYYHWLPPVKFNIPEGGHLDFEGGFLNFRKLEALPLKKFRARFKDPLIQISPSFVKDIVSRFSSYYARQGQPDIDSEDFVTRYTN